MALKQQILGGWDSAFGDATEYRNVLSGGNQAFFTGFTVEVRQAPSVPTAGTFRNLRVSALTDLPSGDSLVFTFRKNGADTGLTVTLSDTVQTADDVVNTVSVAAGDTVSLKRVSSGAPGANTYFWSVEWEPTTADTSVHGYGSGSSNLAADLYEGVFAGGVIWETENLLDIVAVAGQLTKHYVILETAPGAGTSRTFVVYKNGVAQDGSGGTTDTRVTIANTNTTGNATFSLTCAVGDRLSVKNTVSGAVAATRQVGSFAYHSDTPDAWNLSGSATGPITGTSTLYLWPHGDDSATDATETNVQHRAPVRLFSVHSLRVALDAAPGASKEWQFTYRANAADTAQIAAVTGTNLTATGPATLVQIASGDLLSLKVVPVNTPAGTNGQRWTFAAGPAQLVGSAVFGVHTTVDATRAVAFGLDGNTNTHSEPGVNKTFGAVSASQYVEVIEMTAPTGVANKARIYAVDNGAGKTKLMVIFGSGAAVQIAIEP